MAISKSLDNFFIYKAPVFFARNNFTKALYWILQFTWGGILNIVGALVFLAINGWLRIVGIFQGKRLVKTRMYNGAILTKFGKRWGGASLGAFIFSCAGMDLNADYAETIEHEFGHAIQNAILGPFMIFMVSIPSSIRYWMFNKRLYWELESMLTSIFTFSYIMLIVVMFVGAYLGLWWMIIIDICLSLYCASLLVYFVKTELPQYKCIDENGNWSNLFKIHFPDYDTPWFEHSATHGGKEASLLWKWNRCF